MRAQIRGNLPILLAALAVAAFHAPAQSSNPAKLPAGTDARQSISNKLDRIRLDKVAYDGLPLSEVVAQLAEQSKKLDPEKKGINFVLNPNQLIPAGAPYEPVDINSVSVRLPLPLHDVRLMDVLDAIVKVADLPLRYEVQNYGVVFELAPREPDDRDRPLFVFQGGSPGDLLAAVQEQCHVNWRDVANVPAEMNRVRVPALRVNRSSLALLGRNRSPGANAGLPAHLDPADHPAPAPGSLLSALIALYNNLGNVRPELGRLIVEGDLANPSVVMFVGGPKERVPEIQVKAFPLKAIPEKEWKRLELDIRDAVLAATKAAADARHRRGLPASSDELDGSCSFNRDTSLLIATGGSTYIETVGSIVEAYRNNARETVGQPAASQ